MLLILATALLAAIAMASLLKCPVAVAAPTAFFTIILVLFVFGAVEQLYVGWVVVYVLVVLGAAAGLLLQWRREGARALLRWVATPATVLYLLMLALFAISSRGLRFASGDEFSHWGRVVAAMVSGDALPPYSTADLTFAAYPPALPIWQYFLSNGRSEFVEADVFLAYHSLTLALFLPFAAHMRWRRPRHLLFFVAATTLLMTSFFSLDAILIDPALAMVFGYCAALGVIGSLDGRSVWRHLGPALAVLALFKDTGVLLALIALALLLARTGLRERVQSKHQVLGRVPAWIVSGCLGLICVLVPTLVWRAIVVATDTRANWEGGPSFGAAVVAPLLGRGEQWRNDTTTAFVSALGTEPITTSPVPLSFWGWFAVAILGLAAVDHLCHWSLGLDGPTVTRLPATATLLSGALVYATTLYIAYMMAFTQYEASRLASFGRYIEVYWLAVVTLFVAVTLWVISPGTGARAPHLAAPSSSTWNTPRLLIRMWTTVLLAGLLSLSQVHEIAEVISRQHVKNSTAVRGPYDATANLARQAGIGNGDRVWILDEHTTGFAFYVLSYELFESHTGGWSAGPLKDEADVWTRDLTVDQLATELSNYDYLLVHNTEIPFEDRYRSLFQDPSALKDQTVFEIRTSATNGVELIAIDAS